jgi:hypothetical protein
MEKKTWWRHTLLILGHMKCIRSGGGYRAVIIRVNNLNCKYLVHNNVLNSIRYGECTTDDAKYVYLPDINKEPGQRSRYGDWLRAGRQRARCSRPGRVKNFLLFMSSRPALGSTQPPIHWVPGAPSSRVKRPGREADRSPPASAEVKKMWFYTSTPPYAFMAQCLIR